MKVPLHIKPVFRAMAELHQLTCNHSQNTCCVLCLNKGRESPKHFENKLLDPMDKFHSPKHLEDKLLDPIDKFLDAVDEFLSPKHLDNKWTLWACYSAPIPLRTCS